MNFSFFLGHDPCAVCALFALGLGALVWGPWFEDPVLAVRLGGFCQGSGVDWGPGMSTNWESDIAWRLAHGIVKTRAYLKRWQRLQVSDRCTICGQIESFSHALCECTLPPAIWAWIFSITNNLYANTVGFSPPLVLLKHSLPTGAQHERSNAVTRFLINLALNKIWATRNLHTLEGKPSTASLVINKIK